MISATLDGLTFSTVRGAATCTLASIAGWYGPPPEKTQLDERPSADGAFGQSVFHRSARPITLSGLVLTDGHGLPQWEALSALMSSGVPQPLVVTDASGPKSALVKISGSSSDLVPLSDGTAAYVLSLVAFDPVKYGQPKQLSTGLPTAGGGLEYPLASPSGALFYGDNGNLGRVSVTNVGTASVSPRVRVTGGLPSGFEAVRLDTGQRLRYTRVVPDGTDVLIDCRTGDVLIDGTSDGSTYLTVADFFQAAPGEMFEVQFLAIGGSTGTPTMTVEWSDGWW